MKWSVHQLRQLAKGNGIVKIDETANVSGIKEIDSSIRDISEVHVRGRADVNPGRITFHLSIEGTMTLPCSRTLVDVPYPFKIDTIETFLIQPSDYEEDEEYQLIQGDMVDLLPVIKENILLEIPIQVFCEDVQSDEAAPQSGRDWKVVSEKEKEEKVDPRLAGLAKFFETGKDS